LVAETALLQLGHLYSITSARVRMSRHSSTLTLSYSILTGSDALTLPSAPSTSIGAAALGFSTAGTGIVIASCSSIR